MKRRAMYRWKSFWLGVLVLVVMVGAWVRSMRQGERIGIDGPVMKWSSVALAGGSFSVSTQYVWGGPAHEWKRFSWPMGNDEGDAAWAFREWDQPSVMMRWVAFPLWVPMAAWSAVWGGWLVWRARGERRASLTECRMETEGSR